MYCFHSCVSVNREVRWGQQGGSVSGPSLWSHVLRGEDLSRSLVPSQLLSMSFFLKGGGGGHTSPVTDPVYHPVPGHAGGGGGGTYTSHNRWTPTPPSPAQDTQRAVCLLQSRSRTFLLLLYRQMCWKPHEFIAFTVQIFWLQSLPSDLVVFPC